MDTKKLRQKILDLAIHGKLVPQDPNDEPASVLLERIRAEKERLVKEGKIKKSKASKTSDTPHYENVPFEVPSSWEWTTLQNISTIIGDGLHGTPQYDSSGDYYFINGNNLSEHKIKIKEDTKRVSENEYLKYRKPLNETSILVSINGTIGNVGTYNGERVILGKSACYFNISSLLHKVYFCYLLESDYFLKYAFKSATGSTIKNVPLKAINDFFIPLPPLAEQRRIIAEIEKWFSLINQIEQGKADLQTVIKQTKSKILDLAIHGKLMPQDPNDEPASELLKRINPKAGITCDNGQYGKVPEEWIICTIGDLFDVVSAKRVLKSDWKNKGIPFYRAREIVQLHKEGIADKDLFITEELFAELKDKFGTPNVGDIMLSAVGSIGYTYIVNEKDSFYYKDASVLCLRNVNKLNSQYFSMLFETTFVKEQMHDNSKGTTVDTITIEKLKKYFVPLPPLAEQHRIVTKIEELFSSLDNIQKALEV